MNTATIQMLKEKHGDLKGITFDDGKLVLFRKPTRVQLKMIMAKGSKGAVDMTESYVRNCHVGGDLTKEEILDDKQTSYLASLVGSFDDLLEMKKLEVKNY